MNKKYIYICIHMGHSLLNSTRMYTWCGVTNRQRKKKKKRNIIDNKRKTWTNFHLESY